jgi:hypothetical protein
LLEFLLGKQIRAHSKFSEIDTPLRTTRRYRALDKSVTGRPSNLRITTTQNMHKLMRALALLLLFAVLAISCNGQLPNVNDKAVKGTFYYSVDDRATVYVNGQKAMFCDRGEGRSPEMELKTGDHVVVQLVNDVGPRWFCLVFASSDGQSLVSFRAHDFKIIPDLAVTDFRPEQLQGWTKYAKAERHKSTIPVKSYSEYLWGDFDKCIVGCVITPQMISQRPK